MEVAVDDMATKISREYKSLAIFRAIPRKKRPMTFADHCAVATLMMYIRLNMCYVSPNLHCHLIGTGT